MVFGVQKSGFLVCYFEERLIIELLRHFFI